MKKSYLFVLLLCFLLLDLCPGGWLAGGSGSVVEAASVTWKSPFYVTTKINRNKLKKGKKAKVTVTVKNSTGTSMKKLSIKTTLPAQLKKTSGSLKKSKSSLNNNKSVSYSFYVKAKKALSFKKKLSSTKKVTGDKTTVTVKNRVQYGSAKKNLKVTLSFTTPAETTTSQKPETTPIIPVEENVDYAQEMVSLLSSMKTYAKKKNSGFAMISNGGYHLYAPKAVTQTAMLNAIDGALIEEVFDDNDSSAMKKALQAAMNKGKKAFDIEYPDKKGKYDYAAAQSAATQLSNQGIVCYVSEEKDLSTIPAFTTAGYDSSKLSDVKNFMAILNPEKKYSKKADYLAALKNTDYDLIFVDLYFGEDSDGNPMPLKKEEVRNLKTKKNGGSRMVCAYLSVGEAEAYRYYWDSSWDKEKARPDWICEENDEWDENFKVKYWRQEWKDILYGKEDRYLDKILSAGFDGVYLDVVDAYEYFEKK